MFVSLDLETTGFDPFKDKIIEFGAVKFDLNGKKETLQFLINPGIRLPQIITHITGIKDEDLSNASKFSDKSAEIKEFIGDLPIIGHNIKFDTGFLKANGIEIGVEYDTCQLASILLPSLPSYSLEILSHQLKLTHEEKHRALDDAIATMELFLKLKDEFEYLPKETIERIHNLCSRTNWPLKNFLLTLGHKENQTKTTTKENSTPQQKEFKLPENFSAKKETALFENPPPYIDLIKTLAEKADKDSYISIHHQLFYQIEKEIPDFVAKIDAPSKYISSKRLKTFEEKEFFEDYEFSALLKYIIWIAQTKTGLLNEITLFSEEKSTIYKVNIDENLTKLEEETFFQKALEKDKNCPAICTHQYIIETKPKIKELIIIDLDEFTKTLFFKTTTYLKLDIFINPILEIQEILKENETVKTLISKATILFGLIGIIFEKNNDQSPYGPKAMITNLEIESQDWTEIKNSISNLIEISKELGEINNEKTYGHLQNWKNKLKTLHEIFFTPDLENNSIWLEEDQNQNTIIKKIPFSTKDDLKEILNNCENYKIISENLDLNDNATFIKTLLDLPLELKLYKSSQKKENLKIIITDKELTEDKNSLTNFLSNYIQNKKGSTAIIFNSKQQLQYTTLKLSPLLKKTDTKIITQMTGSLGKITEQFKQNPKNSVLLITPNFWENFKNHELIDNLIILKIPFDPPSDPQVLITSKNFENPFIEFQIPRAVFGLKKIINCLDTNPTTQKEVIILDSRITTKDYGKIFLENLKCFAEIEVKTLQ